MNFKVGDTVKHMYDPPSWLYEVIAVNKNNLTCKIIKVPPSFSVDNFIGKLWNVSPNMMRLHSQQNHPHTNIFK